MSTEKQSENTQITTENNTSENKSNDNKTVFGPLGKYAVIAVIMVSIIVTTAIMLDKDLNTAEDQLAAIENEVAESLKVDTDSTVTTKTTEVTAASTNNENTADTVTSENATPTSTAVATADTLVSGKATAEETASATAGNTEQSTTAEQLAKTEPATTTDATQANQAQLAENKDEERQARIEANKLEQKQHMAEMFARVKKLEAQQLDQYKVSQDKRIERLREQIAQQQKMIDTLVLRNKEIYDLRAASVQRNQANREQALNRI